MKKPPNILFIMADQLALAAHSDEAVEARKRFAAKKKPRA